MCYRLFSLSTAAQILTVEKTWLFTVLELTYHQRQTPRAKFLVRGVFLRPHLIPQSFSEHMETVETRFSKSKWFPDKRATKCLKCPEKSFSNYLGPSGRRFKSCHSDHKRALKKMPKRKALIYQGFSAFSGQVFQHRFYRCQMAKILYWQDLNPQIAKITPKGVWKVKIHTPFSFAQKHYSPLCFHTAIKY